MARVEADRLLQVMSNNRTKLLLVCSVRHPFVLTFIFPYLFFCASGSNLQPNLDCARRVETTWTQETDRTRTGRLWHPAEQTAPQHWL